MIDYYDYIQSQEWFERSEPFRDGLCKCCNMRWIKVVHHRNYERLGGELDTDLIGLCLECHEMVHGKAKHFIWYSRRKFLKELQTEMKEIGLYGTKY